VNNPNIGFLKNNQLTSARCEDAMQKYPEEYSKL